MSLGYSNAFVLVVFFIFALVVFVGIILVQCNVCRPLCLFRSTIIEQYNSKLINERLCLIDKKKTTSYISKISCFMCCRNGHHSYIYLKNSKRLTDEYLQKSPSKLDRMLKYFFPFPETPKNEKCPLCLNVLADSPSVILLKCEHAYDERCISEWLVNAKILHKTVSCPLCQDELKYKELSNNLLTHEDSTEEEVTVMRAFNMDRYV